MVFNAPWILSIPSRVLFLFNGLAAHHRFKSITPFSISLSLFASFPQSPINGADFQVVLTRRLWDLVCIFPLIIVRGPKFLFVIVQWIRYAGLFRARLEGRKAVTTLRNVVRRVWKSGRK